MEGEIVEINGVFKELTFRALKLEDFTFVSKWNQDKRFCEANDWPKNRDEDELFRWWNRCIAMQQKDFIRLGIELNQTLIGYVDLAEIKNNSAEIGIAIGDSKLWNVGIGTYAVRKLIDYAKNELGITIFYGETHETNFRSGKMMEKLGFMEVSRIGNETYLGKEVGLVQYRLCLNE